MNRLCLSKARLLAVSVFRVLAWCSLLLSVEQSLAVGKVYLVVGSDTAIWNAGTTVDVFTRHPHYRQDSFTDSNAPIFQAMSPGWRNLFKDSFGQSIKFTWWMMGGNIYRDADNLNVPLANTMVLHLMKQYHGVKIQQFGDELSLHYHTFFGAITMAPACSIGTRHGLLRSAELTSTSRSRNIFSKRECSRFRFGAVGISWIRTGRRTSIN